MNSSRALLWPVSLLYSAITRARAGCYRIGICSQKRLNGTVLSVGNLTVGGTGKTPMVIYLAGRLAAEGKKVAVLTRGYRGARGSSDEASLLRRRLGDNVKVGVGADRYLAGRKLALEGFEWFVMDDGYQHQRLARDVNILLLDASDPFGGGSLLPAGNLREPKSALARADIVVITRRAQVPAIEATVRRYSSAPVFHAQTKLEGVFTRTVGSSDESLNWRGKKLFAFCGIGNPQAFFEDLRRWQIQFSGSFSFPDHHKFTAEDAEGIERRASAAGAEALVCTEKDVFNLSPAMFSRLPVAYCRISFEIPDEERFWQSVEVAIARHQEKSET
jgi:tetraacyldisaccharide 4'-kinase